LPTIHVPTLVMTGDSDQVIPMQRAEAMANAIPQNMYVVVEACGHMPMYEQPHACGLAIQQFIESFAPRYPNG
jgi:pimeloyl-ACP methyl ester carboxylesterase